MLLMALAVFQPSRSASTRPQAPNCGKCQNSLLKNKDVERLVRMLLLKNSLQISATNQLSPGHARHFFIDTTMMVQQDHAKSSSTEGAMAMTTTSVGSQHATFGADTIVNVDADC